MLRTIFAANAKILLTILVLWLGFALWWMVASDYSDRVVAGTYQLTQDGDKSTLILKRDHTFQQELNHLGTIDHAGGSWRRSGEGGISFSKEFLMLSEQEREPDGTGFGEIHKLFGFLVSNKT